MASTKAHRNLLLAGLGLGAGLVGLGHGVMSPWWPGAVLWVIAIALVSFGLAGAKWPRPFYYAAVLVVAALGITLWLESSPRGELAIGDVANSNQKRPGAVVFDIPIENTGRYDIGRMEYIRATQGVHRKRFDSSLARLAAEKNARLEIQARWDATTKLTTSLRKGESAAHLVEIPLTDAAGRQYVNGELVLLVVVVYRYWDWWFLPQEIDKCMWVLDKLRDRPSVIGCGTGISSGS
jgi:hypothetical protein